MLESRKAGADSMNNGGESLCFDSTLRSSFPITLKDPNDDIRGLFVNWSVKSSHSILLPNIFEDDFLILFFTEALFYCGVAGFLFLADCVSRPLETVFASTNHNLAPHLGNRIASVAVLVLSLTIPMVTMGFVWPWTGPAASATLAPYLVGIIVQFAFEQYAKYVNSPSWPAIPIIFQVYRLHQLNRAAQLVRKTTREYEPRLIVTSLEMI